MYRCRSLLFLLHEKTGFTTHAQVTRCGFFTSRVFSPRHFSESANVGNLMNEEDTNDKISSKKVSKPKLFSFDKIYDDDTKVSVAKGKKSVKPDNIPEVFSTTEGEPEVLDDPVRINQAPDFADISKGELKDEKKVKKVEKEKQTHVKEESLPGQTSSFNESFDHPTEKPHRNKVSSEILFGELIPDAEEKKVDNIGIEQGMEVTKDIEQGMETTNVEPDADRVDKGPQMNDDLTDVKIETKEPITDQAKEIKTVDDNENKFDKNFKSMLKKKKISDAKVTQRIFVMDNPEEILYNLGVCFDSFDKGNLSRGQLKMVIICTVQKLKLLKSLTFTPNLVDSLNAFLVNESFVSSMGKSDLFNILDFFIMRSSKDDAVTETLLHELCWRLRHSTLKETLDVLALLKLRVTTTKRKEVHVLASQRLNEVISQTSTPKEVLALMYIAQDTSTQNKAEEEAIHMLQSFDSLQSYRLLTLLMKRKSSNFHLIQLVKDHLFLRPLTLDVEQLKNIFFICARLEERNSSYLRELSVCMLECIENQSGNVKRSILLGVLQSCSILGWNHGRLSNKILDDLCKNEDELLKKAGNKALKSLLMSLCHLNLDAYREFSSKIARHLNSDETVVENSRIDIIKSLASIKMAEKDEVLTVLQPAFYQPMLDKLKDSPKSLQIIAKSNLLRLYGYLREDLKETTILEFDTMASELGQQLQEEMKSAPLSKFAKRVSEVVERIAPLHTYTNVHVVTRYGYTIDFELFVNKSLKAVRLEDKEGQQRVWIKLLPQKAFIRGEDTVTMSPETKMMIQHIQSEKDTAIIFIDYLKWMDLSQMSDHLLYIESLINTAINGDSNGKDMDTAGKE